MKRILSIGILFVLLCTACQEKEDIPATKGEITLSTEFFGTTVYYVNGFSFEEDKFIPTMNSGGKVPDIIGLNHQLGNGTVIGMYLSTNGINSYGFYKNFEGSLPEGVSFFENYLVVDAPELFALSDTLRSGQVYTFRTIQKNYVKILVKDVRIKTDSPLSDYVEADLRYYIQRDGSDIFDE